MITRTIATMRTVKHHLTNWLDAAPQSAALINNEQSLESDRRQIRRIQRAIRKLHVVGPDKQVALQEVERLRRKQEHRYNVILTKIQQHLEFLCERYAVFYEAWTGQPLLPGRQPVTLDDAIALGRKCRLAAIVAVGLDVLIVTSLMQQHYGWFWAFFGALVPMALAAALIDRVITATTTMICREALHRRLHLIGYLFWPTLLSSLVSLLVLLAERYMSGLSPVLTMLFDGGATLAFFVITPSLMFLSASLLAMGEIYSWSLPLSRNFDQFLQQYADVVHEQREFLTDARSLTDKDDKSKPPSQRFFPPSFMLALVLAGSGFLAGCGARQSQDIAAPQASMTVAATQPSNAILNIEIDQSGSVEAEAGHAAAQTLYQQLEAIIAALRAVELRLRSFTTNGWSAPVTQTVVLPLYQEPVIPSTEFSHLPHREADWKNLKAEREKQADQQYQADLKAALAQAKVTAALLDPATAKSAPGTDVYGVLSRISKGQHGAREEVYIVITDGYDTGSKGATPALKPPQGKVQVVVFVTAALAKESRGRSPQQQFESREEWLKKVAPWAKAVAAYETNLAEMLRPAKDAQLAANATKEARR